MQKSKKIILGLSIFFSMLVALVIGVHNISGKVKRPDMTTPIVVGTQGWGLAIEKGDDEIHFEYDPQVNAGAVTKAYEYIFTNPMSVSTGIGIKPVTVPSGVTVAYKVSSSQLSASSLTSGSSSFTATTISAGGKMYAYVIITASSESTALSFTSSVTWYYGKPGTMVYNIDGSVTSQAIVKNQYIYQPSHSSTVFWFYDSSYTQMATFPFRSEGTTLYGTTSRDKAVYSKNGTTDSDGYVLYGAYPQDFVGNTLNTTLKTALSNGELTSTGHSYTTDANGTTKTLPEYYYNGGFYAYLAQSDRYSGYYFQSSGNTGVVVADSSAYFFKVQPLRWKNYSGTYLCEYSIGSCKFGPSGTVLWSASTLRTWLNNTFYQEAGINKIKTAKSTIEVPSTGGKSESTQDYVWVASSNEIQSWISTQAERSASCSDLALATYTRFDTSNKKAYNCWLRDNNGSNPMNVVYHGRLGVYLPYFTEVGVRPCFAL